MKVIAKCKNCGNEFSIPIPFTAEDMFCPKCKEWGLIEVIGCKE